ncbi:MAG: acyltransferase [Ruminococcus flavefaciens]|nr:acyltransferase [Ruminococcus flavefaciens]
MSGKDRFQKYESIINMMIKIIKKFPRKMRLVLFEANRNTNGTKGIALRYILFASLAEFCGANVAIMPGCYFKFIENIRVGNNVSFQPMSFIGAGGGVTIGNNVSIAHNTTILSTTHTFNDLKQPIKYQPIEMKQTIIQDNVWLGCGAVITAGVIIGTGCVVGANSTVTKSVDDFSIVAGCPAKLIRKRTVRE